MGFFVSKFLRASLLTGLVALAAGPVHAASGQFKDAVSARIDKTYAVVVFANGSKTMVPLASLSADDRARLTALSNEKPLAHGKSEVIVTKEVVKVEQTIATAKTEGGVETVQLFAPNVSHDQLGATCMLYARVHWLDIAGYGIEIPTIYKITNGVDPDKPYLDSRYHVGMDNLLGSFTPRPLVHELPSYEENPFDWARAELRKGRPILAAFPKEIWQALPPGFIAAHPWNGGSVGHQVVINGFTWNPTTQQGTFHIVNSWNELPEFDLKTDAAKGGAMIVQQSMSPRGEVRPQTEKEVVQSIALVRAVGKTNLYEVETNRGKRKIAAVSEEAARAMIEEAR